MLELRIHAGRPAIPLYDLSAALGRAEAARTVGDQIEAMMNFLDDLGGDPDLEDNGDLEPDADREVGYSEWHTRESKTTSAGYEIGETAQTSDDDEDADPAEDDGEDCCDAGDDWIAAGCAPASRGSDRWQTVGNEDDGEDDDGEPMMWGSFCVVDVYDLAGRIIGRSMGYATIKWDKSESADCSKPALTR